MRRASPLAAELPPSRLRMEVDCLLSHGAAAASWQLLHGLGLLERLLPQLAAMAADPGASSSSSSSSGSSSSSSGSRGGGFEGTQLLDILRELDSRVSPVDRAPPEVVAALLVAALVQARLCAARQWQQHEEELTEDNQQQQQVHSWPGGLLQSIPLFMGKQQQQSTTSQQQQEGRLMHTAQRSSSNAAGERAQLHSLVWDAAEEVRCCLVDLPPTCTPFSVQRARINLS
jgi:tRNA nucleotidyltransferase/poly(A) polymerase